MTTGPEAGRSFSWRGAIVAALPALALLVLAFVATRPIASPTGARGAGPGAPAVGLAVGDRAPDFLRPDGTPGLMGLDSRPIRLADFAGHPLWIVFWATWCTPCYEEAPQIEASLQAHAGTGLTVLAIAVQDPESSVRDFMARYGLDYVAALDSTAAMRDLFGGWGLPIHFFLDGSGTIRDRYIGELTHEGMETHLRSIIGDAALVPDR